MTSIYDNDILFIEGTPVLLSDNPVTNFDVVAVKKGSDPVFSRIDGTSGISGQVLTLLSNGPQPVVGWATLGGSSALILQNTTGSGGTILTPSPLAFGNAYFKRIVAGSGISVTDNGTSTITIGATGGAGSLAVANGNTLAASPFPLMPVSPVSTGVARIKQLVAGSNVTLTNTGTGAITIAAASSSSLSVANGNTLAASPFPLMPVSPVSTGFARVKQLVAGSNITLTNTGTGAITIAATGGGGSSLTVANSNGTGTFLVANGPVSSGTASIKRLIARNAVSLATNGTSTISIISYDAYDAIVAATGEQYSTINAAIAAGKKRIAIVGNTTQTVAITLTYDVSIKLFNGAIWTVSGLNTAINLSNFSLSVEGAGTIAWVPASSTNSRLFNGTVSSPPDYSYPGVSLNGITIDFGSFDNKTITNVNQTLNNVILLLPDQTVVGFNGTNSTVSEVSNTRFVSKNPLAHTGTKHFVSSPTSKVVANNLVISGTANGTSIIMQVGGDTSIIGTCITNNANYMTIDLASANRVIIDGVTNSSSSGVAISNSVATYSFDDSIQISNISSLDSILLKQYYSWVNNIAADTIILKNYANYSNINNAKCRDCIIESNNTKFSNSNITNSLTITGGKHIINGNYFSGTNVNITGYNNIFSNNIMIGNLTIGSGSTTNIVSNNILDNPVVITGSVGTVLVGNTYT